MFTHVMVGTDNLDQSVRFYDATFGALGIERAVATDSRAFYRSSAGSFGVVRPRDGKPARHANGGTIGFAAKDKDMVDAWHEAGIRAGGIDEGAPGPRPNAPGKAYGAYLRDPYGNKLCVFCQLPE